MKLSDFKCCICGKGPAENVTLHRVNAKGVAPIMACAKHIKQTDGRIDPLAKQVTDIIERASHE